MTIRPGESWGAPCDIDPGWPCARTDAELAAALPGPVVVAGGDLHTTLGGRGGPVAQLFPIDVLVVEVGGQRYRAVAHVVIRGPLWSGPTIVAMNASYLGRWYLGPRAHPNDGLVDVTVGELAFGQRWQARSRALSGAHLPHPGLRYRRVDSFESVVEVRRSIWVDGRRRGAVAAGSALRITVEPDAASVALAAGSASANAT